MQSVMRVLLSHVVLCVGNLKMDDYSNGPFPQPPLLLLHSSVTISSPKNGECHKEIYTITKHNCYLYQQTAYIKTQNLMILSSKGSSDLE